jgi:NAD(P)-dependent dehydrogenase (short-subunit alcohol dehydrogenase family)
LVISKTVVVTGCSSGFGRDVALVLARRGDRVFATMRGIEGKNAAVAAELRGISSGEGIALQVLEMDVMSTDSVDAAAARVLAEAGAPDVVINNAGQMFVGIAEAFTPDEVTRQLDVNVVGVHRVHRAFLPSMRERASGLFINISSIAGRIAVPFNAVYHASKWALEGYSVALRTELASLGIDVVLVEPGPFTTNLFPGMVAPADAEGRGARYPPLVQETFAGMAGMFQSMFQDPETPTDPQMVVECMVELIDMKPGTRPLRSVVGIDFGTRDRNATVEPFDVGTD